MANNEITSIVVLFHNIYELYSYAKIVIYTPGATWVEEITYNHRYSSLKEEIDSLSPTREYNLIGQ